MSIRPALWMQQIVATNRCCLRIRKQSERIPGFAGKVQRNSRFIDADSNGTYTGLLELRELFLYAS